MPVCCKTWKVTALAALPLAAVAVLAAQAVSPAVTTPAVPADVSLTSAPPAAPAAVAKGDAASELVTDVNNWKETGGSSGRRGNRR